MCCMLSMSFARTHLGTPSTVKGRQTFPVSQRQLRFIDRASTPQTYTTVWKWQKKLVQRLHCEKGGQETVLLVQHEPTYTLEALPYPLIRAERGGEVTFHGPGQLVLYPILDLHHHRCDLHWYLRQLEEVALVALREVSGIEGKRIEGWSGVWVNDAKIASVGIRAKRWVTYHGLALNIAMDLTPFDAIVPCGITDCPVTSVKRILHGERLQVGKGCACSMEDDKLMQEYRFGLMDAFSQVFNVDLDWHSEKTHTETQVV